MLRNLGYRRLRVTAFAICQHNHLITFGLSEMIRQWTYGGAMLHTSKLAARRRGDASPYELYEGFAAQGGS